MKNCIHEIAFPQLILEREIKKTDRSRVCIVRNKETAERYIYRSFTGTGEVYRRMLGIDCPYLPKIHDVKEENGTVLVLEEYIQGDTLAFLLESRPLTPNHAKQIIIHICRALNVLHGIGAVHRDIKPDNIILRGSDAVLIDFDASRLRKTESITDTKILGTTGYAAPEQYGFSQTDSRTDIYSLGILLNEMLTGQHPSRALAEGEFRPIIEKCTRINADQRYASVTELIAAIDELSGKQKLPIRLLSVLLLSFLLAAGLLYCSLPQAPMETQAIAGRPTEPPTTPPTETPMEKPTEPVTIGQWEGATDGYATTFYYDLNGDGKQEQYLFGVDFLESPHDDVVYYEVNGSHPGEQHLRDIHPCVWHVGSDGSLEVAEEFAELLTDTQSNIWRLDDLSAPDPKWDRAEYIWPGAISITFAPEKDSTWLYEVTAYIDDLKLTAQAPFRFIPHDSFS